MNKFQPFAFRSLDDFFDHLPPEQLRIVQVLRKLVLECIPDCKEKLSYNVPYYSRHYRICYIWPGSVPWGKTVKEGVDLGFCKGSLLSDASYLSAGNRKEVFTKTFYTTKDIDADTVRQLLYEAAVVDADCYQNKKQARY